jgi:hypothetical protein
MPKKKTKRLGAILLDEGLITAELLEQGLRRRGQSAKRLGPTLVKPGLLEPAVLARVLARQAGAPGCDLFAVRIQGGEGKITKDRDMHYCQDMKAFKESLAR